MMLVFAVVDEVLNARDMMPEERESPYRTSSAMELLLLLLLLLLLKEVVERWAQKVV